MLKSTLKLNEGFQQSEECLFKNSELYGPLTCTFPYTLTSSVAATEGRMCSQDPNTRELSLLVYLAALWKSLMAGLISVCPDLELTEGKQPSSPGHFDKSNQ